MYIINKISFKLLDKLNLYGIIKNVENRWIDDSSRFHSFGNKPILIRLLPIDGLVLFIVICYVIAAIAICALIIGIIAGLCSG